MVRVDNDKSSNDYQTRSCMARSMDEKLVKPLGIEKNEMEKREAKTRECSKTERIFTVFILMTKITQRNSKMRGESWKDLCKRKARTSTTKVAAKQEIASQKIPKKTIYGWVV